MKNLPILILLAFALISATGCKKAVCVPDYSTTESSKYLTVKYSGDKLSVFNNSTSKVYIVSYCECYIRSGKIQEYCNDYGGKQADRNIGVWLSTKLSFPPNSKASGVMIRFKRINCESYSNGQDTEQAYYSF